MAKEWLGWHFLGSNRRVAHYPGSNLSGTLVVPGLKLKVDGKIIPCQRGLHASKKPLDALYYAPGPIVQRVRLSGTIKEQHDKAAASERTTLWLMDASLALHVCAVHYAQRALDREAKVDPRSQEALNVKLRWIGGEASAKDLAAATRAALKASPKSLAASAAADAVALCARNAAWNAAGDAAEDAAWVAAWDAERELQNQMLEAALFAQYETGHGVFSAEGK